MKSDDGRKRILWLAAIGGVLILAIVFVSVAAPQPKTGTTSDFRITPGTVDETTGADQAAEPDTGGRPGFSLSAGGAVSLIWRLGLVALVIAGAVVGLRWWGRKAIAPRSTTGFLRIIDTLAISNGRTIHLVALGDRVIVIGATAQQMAYLNELTDEESDEVMAKLARNDETNNLSGFAAELFQSLRREQRTDDSVASIALSHEDGR